MYLTALRRSSGRNVPGTGAGGEDGVERENRAQATAGDDPVSAARRARLRFPPRPFKRGENQALMETNSHAIRLTGFSYTYEDGTEALRNVSMTVSRGESVALIGRNGSGKTTLLMHLVGILMPGEEVSVAGFPVKKENLKEIRRRVGYVFQDSRDQLFMSTVVEDVAFGPLNMGMSRGEAFERARRALSSVGMAGSGNRIPYHLSGGEMKRVAIATVLAVSPDILVMDEPSSGLDPRARRELAALIRGFSCTRIIASHDLEFVRACTDRVILLNDGRVVADGPAEEIIGDTELLVRNGL